MTFFERILADVRTEITDAKALRSEKDLRAKIAAAPPVRDFAAALSGGFGLIAEIKKCSPSMGFMRPENVQDAAAAYEASSLVRAISVLTNRTHFGMRVEDLERIRAAVSKPVLRKDFILEEYQILEARAFGADAILLMANVLNADQLKMFYSCACDLGMEVLFEVHTAEEIEMLPTGVRVCGINSRKFKSDTGFLKEGETATKDFTLDMSVFDLAKLLPKNSVRVAESGLTPKNIREFANGFDAALVGTSLLRDEEGIHACLKGFETAFAAA
ncbi:MAG: indole-3-glycerol phosphate synthase TrpC [Chthoniobacterales bacterium]